MEAQTRSQSVHQHHLRQQHTLFRKVDLTVQHHDRPRPIQPPAKLVFACLIDPQDVPFAIFKVLHKAHFALGRLLVDSFPTGFLDFLSVDRQASQFSSVRRPSQYDEVDQEQAYFHRGLNVFTPQVHERCPFSLHHLLFLVLNDASGESRKSFIRIIKHG